MDYYSNGNEAILLLVPIIDFILFNLCFLLCSHATKSIVLLHNTIKGSLLTTDNSQLTKKNSKFIFMTNVFHFQPTLIV